MVNAQGWLENNYPKEKRKEVTELNISSQTLKEIEILKPNEYLDGFLDLHGFTNLKKLDCSCNNLVKLNIDECKKIEYLNCSNNLLTGLEYSALNPSTLTELHLVNNKWSPQALTHFSRFKNLKKLLIGNNKKDCVERGIYNRFDGSLKPLENLTKLEELDISNTNIFSGLEYLPESLQKIVYLGKNERSDKVKSNQLLENLQLFFKQESGNDYYDMTEWRKNYSKQNLVAGKESKKQKVSLEDIQEKNQVLQEQLRTKENQIKELQFKYNFYEQFFNDYLENRRTELNQIKNKLTEEEQEYFFETYYEAKEELKQKQIDRSFAQKQLEKSEKKLLMKITSEELEILCEKQAEINQLERQIFNLQTQEQQHLENRDDEDKDVQFVYEPKEEISNNYSSESTQNKYLDALARLFTGKETCVGVCFYQGKLIIASNWESPKRAKEYLESLRKFINNQTSENFEELIKLTLSTNEFYYLEENGGGAIKNFQKLVNDYKKEKMNLNVLQKNADELFGDLKRDKNSEAGKKWEYLITWHDVGEIVEAIRKKKLDEFIIKSIKEDNIEFIEGKYIRPEDREKRLHTEMKIVEKIYEKEDDISKGVVHYIGLNKLTCDDCYAVISILNSEGYKWEVCGRHGSGNEYTESWITPVFMRSRKGEIEEWKEKNKAKEKKKETTSKIPEKLSDLNLLLEELKNQETISQIQIPPK